MPVRRRPTLRPTATGLTVLALCVLGTRVLRDHPSPWLRIVLAGGLVLVVTDVVWSLVAVRRLHVELVPAPVGVAGVPLVSRLALSGSSADVLVRMLSVEHGPEVLVHAPTAGAYAAPPDRRGLFPAATVRTVPHSPFGLLAGGWVWTLAFATPVVVGPAPIAVTVHGDDARPDVAEGFEETRGVRPYVAGDRPALVHWPASARAGRLVIRQLDDRPPRRSTVVAALGDHPGPGAERAAAVAAGLALALLERGDRVEIVTTAGHTSVTGPLDVAAALGRAGTGAVGTRGPAYVVRPDGVEVQP